jgi:hypothetical protein
MTRQEKLRELTDAAQKLVSDHSTGSPPGFEEKKIIITSVENWERFVAATNAFWTSEEDE